VRHHGGPENADRDVEHLGVPEDLGPWDQARSHCREVGAGQPELDSEASGDAQNKDDDDRLDETKTTMLHVEHEQHVE
jgi:hypothetical protein